MGYILMIVFFVVVLYLSIINYNNKETGKSLKEEVMDDFLCEKDLPYNRTEKFGKFNIKLYELEKNENEIIDEKSEFYKSALKLIVKYFKIEVENGEASLIIDESHAGYMTDYINLMSLFTNFKFNAFSFKNPNTKIVDFNNNKIKNITDHIDKIIRQVTFIEVENMSKGKYN